MISDYANKQRTARRVMAAGKNDVAEVVWATVVWGLTTRISASTVNKVRTVAMMVGSK